MKYLTHVFLIVLTGRCDWNGCSCCLRGCYRHILCFCYLLEDSEQGQFISTFSSSCRFPWLQHLWLPKDVLGSYKYKSVITGSQKDHEHASEWLGTQGVTQKISYVFPQHKVSKPSIPPEMLTPEMFNQTFRNSNYGVWFHQGHSPPPFPYSKHSIYVSVASFLCCFVTCTFDWTSWDACQVQPLKEKVVHG